MAKPQFTAEQVANALTDTKGMVTVAAKKLGCSPTTVHNYIEKYTSVKDAMNTAREYQLDFTELKLFEEIHKNNISAIIFYLKTVGKRRGYIERTEHINLDVPEELLKEMLDELKAAGLDQQNVFRELIAAAKARRALVGADGSPARVEPGGGAGGE